VSLRDGGGEDIISGARKVSTRADQAHKHPALKRVGVRIRELRLQKGLSQEALADLAGIGRSYMSGFERGVRNCSTLHLLRLAKALGVRVGDLFPAYGPDGAVPAAKRRLTQPPLRSSGGSMGVRPAHLELAGSLAAASVGAYSARHRVVMDRATWRRI
jgi:transcriptional regulator with XRE-family HTH domain